MFSEFLHFLGFDLEPDVINISEPVASCCSLKGARSSIFHLIHVEVGYNNYRNECTAGSLMFLMKKKNLNLNQRTFFFFILSFC